MEWMNRALCREVGGDLFFPDSGGDPTDAKRVCRRCPVNTQCLDYALQFSVLGVWGGTTECERRRMRRERKAG